MTTKEIIARVVLGVAFLVVFNKLGASAWWMMGLAVFVGLVVADVVTRRALTARVVLFQAGISMLLALALRLTM